MAGRDTQRYMKNVNKLFGAAGPRKRPPQRNYAKVAPPSPRREDPFKTAANRSSLASRKRKSANPAGEDSRRVIHWRHYENIFNIMDNLKYQFPALGYERFFDMFTALLTFYARVGITHARYEMTGALPSAGGGLRCAGYRLLALIPLIIGV